MAGIFDIELHDGDNVDQDESDDDIVEAAEVNLLMKILDYKILQRNAYISITYFRAITTQTPTLIISWSKLNNFNFFFFFKYQFCV